MSALLLLPSFEGLAPLMRTIFLVPIFLNIVFVGEELDLTDVIFGDRDFVSPDLMHLFSNGSFLR